MKDFERKQEIIRELKPIDDGFFEKLAEDKEVCQEILQTILCDAQLKVLQVTKQGSIRNLQGRSVRLDALCENADGSFTNIEVQKSDNDNHLKRVRYNAACITANITEPGEDFENVPDVCIVYITRFDLFKADKTIYHIRQVVTETGELIENGHKEIYVNTKIDDGSDIAELMKCFESTEVNNSKFPKLSQRVNYFKHNKEGVGSMNELIKKYLEDYWEEHGEEARTEARSVGRMEGIREGIKEGRIEGIKEGRIEGMKEGRIEGITKMVIQMLKAGKYTLDEISGLSGLSIEEIKAIQNAHQL